jgi:hypothetical protein
MTAESLVRKLRDEVYEFEGAIIGLTSSEREIRLIDIGCVAADSDAAIDKMSPSQAKEAIQLKNEVNESVKRAEGAVNVANFRDELSRALPTLIREQGRRVRRI